ncbi:MAG: tail fiber protein [Proteobacteria bacterium]|nr:tail fiber protein [Pseudomonadota bacterium]
MTAKRFCPATDGGSSLGKDGKRWGNVQTLALNGLGIAPGGAATPQLPGLVILAGEAEAGNPAITTKAVTPAGLMAVADSKLNLAAKATTIQAEAGEDNETWMTPALTAAAITVLCEPPEPVPTGTVLAVASSTPPDGWLECNGASLSTATYAELYAAIGTTFGSGTGTFNLPDLRGEFVRGWDHGRGADSGRVWGSSQADDFRSHAHSGCADVDTSHPANVSEGAGYGAKSGSTAASGGGETRPRNVTLLFIIKY